MSKNLDPIGENDSMPCLLMRGLISDLSDGRLKGVLRWYAERHTADCPHCGPALTSIVVLQTRLRTLRSTPPESDISLRLPPEVHAIVEAEWAKIDAKAAG